MTQSRHYLITLRPPRPRFAETITEAEAMVIDAHFEYLSRLRDEGILCFAGRRDDAAFGLAIVRASSEQEAQGIASADPAVTGKVFTAEIAPFSIALWGAP
ncbi:MAG: hypothetical protein HY898_00600 [Deltaproteobacteria bacterium]|nr:hypothetical protein [Deltaproteobacteria bacterium]